MQLVVGSKVARYDTVSRCAGFGLSDNFECFVCQLGNSLSFVVTHNTYPPQRVAPLLPGGLLLDEHNPDVPMLAITRLVAKIKNASRKAKPFRTIIERPDAVVFRQQVH